MNDLIKQILERLGEDTEREGLANTPARAAETYRYLTKGYQENAKDILNGALFDVEYDEIK